MLAVAQEIPRVSFRTSGVGQTEFEVRGLASSGGATATIGYYLDDIPISPPALGDIGKVVIDPNLYDLSRVEVLRGPQGTLYGAGSMGGTIEVITNPTKLNTFESAVDGSISSTGCNGGTNWDVNALMNYPLATDKNYRPFNSPEPYEDYVRLSDITIAHDFTGYQLASTSSERDRTLTQNQEWSEGGQNICFTPTFYPNLHTQEIDEAVFQHFSTGSV
jgi:outer membrane receptor protein involved in Fe transport